MDQVIKNQKIVTNEWFKIQEEESIPENKKVLISFERWKKEKDTLPPEKVGILFQGKDNVREIKKDIERFSCIGISFPAFADGRGYSQARILREELHYSGELRAVGDILLDQLFFLFRCGFDAFEVREDKDIQEALKRFQDFTYVYQAAADNPLPIYRQK